MKHTIKNSLSYLSFVAIIIIFISSLDRESLNASEWQYYEFFQFIEHHTDGAKERWTGCVTLGTTCFSDGPGIVADCMMPGQTTWRACNIVE